MTSRPVMVLRGLARRMQIRYKTLNKVVGNKKEQKFERELLAEAKIGDIVWDVGAFFGWYTKKLSGAVGPAGQVFALEPNPLTRERLQERVVTEKNVIVLPIALGGTCGSVNFLLRRAKSRVVSGSSQSDVAVVRMATGDAMVGLGEAAQPCLIKIDAEGLELDILKGLSRTLASPVLRAVFIEVHFQLLAERHSAGNVPAEIVELLKSYGFRTRWVGPSHLVAHRGRS